MAEVTRRHQFSRNVFIRKDVIRTVGEAAVYILVRFFLAFVQALPLTTCVRLSRWLGWLFNDVCRIRHTVVDENLAHAFPDWDATRRNQVSRQMWDHFLLMVCELAHSPRKIHETNWRHHVHLRNRRRIVRMMLDPCPVIAVTGHLGNFELCGYVAGLLGFPTFTVARPLDNRFLHDYLIGFRQSTGQFILSTRGSADAAQAVIESNETLALLGDHFAGVKGCWVEFFGRPVSCHKSIALFSLANKAPMMVLRALRRNGEPLQFDFGMVAYYDPRQASFQYDTVPALTQWFTNHLEAEIREHPGQYWWLHRRWKDPRKSRQKKKKPAATVSTID